MVPPGFLYSHPPKDTLPYFEKFLEKTRVFSKIFKKFQLFFEKNLGEGLPTTIIHYIFVQEGG